MVFLFVYLSFFNHFPGISGTNCIIMLSLLSFFLSFGKAARIREITLFFLSFFDHLGMRPGFGGAIFALFGTAARRPEIMVSSCVRALWIQEPIRA